MLPSDKILDVLGNSAELNVFSGYWYYLGISSGISLFVWTKLLIEAWKNSHTSWMVAERTSVSRSLVPDGVGESCSSTWRSLADWRRVCSGVRGNWCNWIRYKLVSMSCWRDWKVRDPWLFKQHKFLSTKHTKKMPQQPDDAWRNGYDQWTGQGWSQGWNNLVECVLEQHQANAQSHDYASVEWRCNWWLWVWYPHVQERLEPRWSLLPCSSIDFWSHWLGERTPQDGGLEQFLDHLKTKMGIRRPQEEGMAFKKYIYQIQRARTSWIYRSDDALINMRKKLARAPGANSSESTMIPPQFQGWLLLHVEKSLLDLFTDDVLQSVDRSHDKDSGNHRKQHAFEAIEKIPEDDDDNYLDDDLSENDDPYIDEDGNANEEIVSDIDDDLANWWWGIPRSTPWLSWGTRPHEGGPGCSWILSCCCLHSFRQAYRQRQRWFLKRQECEWQD